MTGKYFEEFEIGETFESRTRTVTEADVTFFAGLSGDYNEIHVSEEYAEDTLFGTRVAHGPLVFSIGLGLTTHIGYSEGTVIGLYGIDNMRFPNPVFPGDTVRTVQEVTDLQEKEKGGVVTLRTTVYNQDDEVCVVWDHRKMIQYGDS